MGTNLIGHVERHKVQAHVRNKKNQMHILKCFENQSDAYDDTRTHYLMEQDPFLLKVQADVMDVVVVDKVETLKKKRMGPPGPCSSRSGSRYSMSRTCGP
jgi:hypothetical protein